MVPLMISGRGDGVAGARRAHLPTKEAGFVLTHAEAASPGDGLEAGEHLAHRREAVERPLLEAGEDEFVEARRDGVEGAGREGEVLLEEIAADEGRGAGEHGVEDEAEAVDV